MPSPVDQGAGSKQAEQLGLPEGFKIASAFPFGGLNNTDSRVGIADAEFSWLENYINVGKGKMRAAWDVGAPLYTAPAGKTIVSFYWFNIGASTSCAVFLNDGTAVQVSTTGATQMISSAPGLFYIAGGSLPACCPWGSQYLLISNNNAANNYWVWDGNLLYEPGGVSPVVDISSGGSGYTSAPTVTAFGGAGTGATFTATVVNGSVVQVVPTNPGTGYGPADIVQLEFSGGGTDSGAILRANISGGAVASLLLTNGGSAYTSAPAVAITGGGGTGATAVAIIAGGSVTQVNLTSGGDNYTGTPTISFSGGGGTGAAAVATLSAGFIVSVDVLNGGSGFTSTPVLSFDGGGGTGAAATAIVTAGVISSVTTTAGGSGYTSAPAVVVQSGINNAASASVEMMPIGISGSAIETFGSRAWLTHPFQAGTLPSGGDINITAPDSFTDFATSDGGLLFTNTDRFLRYQYTTLRQSNGYLYTLGDSSVNVISNVQTTGSTVTTTFNNQNIDPQIGSSWRDTCQDYSRTILFANPFGVFGVYGGAITKVSDKINRIFDQALFPPNAKAVTPSAAVAQVFSQRIYLMLMTITDPFTNLPRNAMIGWNEKDWAVYSQTAGLVYIGTQEIASDLFAWGTDGNSLMPLFATASATLEKTLQTKLFTGDNSFLVKASYAIYVTAQLEPAGVSPLTFTSTTVDALAPAVPVSLPEWMDDEVPTQGGSFAMTNPIEFAVPATVPATFGTGTEPVVAGVGLGLTMITTQPDFDLINIQLGYLDVNAIT